MLSIEDHRRDSAGLLYVYPVVSRRAGGVSIGINLNVNNACNWACAYCQVDGLTRGGPPPIDLERLASELRGFLTDSLHGDFLTRSVPADARKLVDVAFSGNGEPTAAREFPDAVGVVGRVLAEFDLSGRLPIRLITNGSLVHRVAVRNGIAQIGCLGGEVWIKVDRASPGDVAAINGVPFSAARVTRSLAQCAALAPTWVQTCWFAFDGVAPDIAARSAYIALVAPFAGKLAGIHLYGLARPSLQPAAPRLARLPAAVLDDFADEIRAKTGIRVVVSP